MTTLLFRHGFLITALVVALVLWATPQLVANTFQLRVVMLFLIYAIVAMGLNLLVGLAGLVSLGQAGIYALGAYVAAVLSVKHGVGFWGVAAAAMALTGLVGALLAYPTVRVRGVYLAVITIAFGLIVQNIAIEWREVTGGTLGISNVPRINLGAGPLTTQGLYALFASIAFVVFLLHHTIMASRFGRAMRAVAQSETAARALGINPISLRVLAFVIAAMTAGLAGALYAYLNRYVNPDTFSFADSIRFLLMVILGGAGTTLGPLVGAGVLTWIPNVLQQFGKWQLFAYGALLAIVIFVLPRGVVGTLGDLADRFLTRGFLARGDAATRKAESWPEPSPAITALLGKPEAMQPAAAKPAPIVATEALTIRFGGLTAVNAVSLAVQPATIHAVIGPNGAGKTTLLNALSGFYRPTEGVIRLNGQPLAGWESHAVARAGLTRTFQNTELFADMTVAENVAVALYSRARVGFLRAALRLPGFFREERDHAARVSALLSYVGLSAFADERARNLPFGHQRRLEIARALALEPSVLLLDEPAAGLTSGEIDALIALIRDLKGMGLTIILVEHHVDMIMAVSDHVTVLDYGEVIASAAPSAVRDDPRVIAAYFGSAAVREAEPA
jgi:ABC-type branched-subunit amino acid transport system ATPase component/ABC-type branched-subunit amino acid transport system permease subunit